MIYQKFAEKLKNIDPSLDVDAINTRKNLENTYNIPTIKKVDRPTSHSINEAHVTIVDFLQVKRLSEAKAVFCASNLFFTLN